MQACSVCGDELPTMLGDHAWCQVEGTCLADCADFVGHCTDVGKYEAELDDWLKETLAEVEAKAQRDTYDAEVARLRGERDLAIGEAFAGDGGSGGGSVN